MPNSHLIQQPSPTWSHYAPDSDRVRSVLAKAGATDAELSLIPKEIAKMGGETQYHEEMIGEYMHELEGSGDLSPSGKKLIFNTRWRDAFRVFLMFPHPELPMQLEDSSGNWPEACNDCRYFYLIAGGIIACSVRGLDLKVLGRYYEITANKAYHTYAEASLARLDMIEKLRNLGRLPLRCTVSGYWLSVEYEIASYGYINRTKLISNKGAFKAGKSRLDNLNNAVSSKQSFKEELSSSLWRTVQKIAANEAIENANFRSSFFKPWQTREKRWLNARKKYLDVIAVAPPRGPRLKGR